MLMFYPCILDKRTGHINLIVGKEMTKEEAETKLKTDFHMFWRTCEGIPQPVTHPYFTDPDYEFFVGPYIKGKCPVCGEDYIEGQKMGSGSQYFHEGTLVICISASKVLKPVPGNKDV